MRLKRRVSIPLILGAVVASTVVVAPLFKRNVVLGVGALVGVLALALVAAARGLEPVQPIRSV
jgi:hypothetical protein